MLKPSERNIFIAFWSCCPRLLWVPKAGDVIKCTKLQVFFFPAQFSTFYGVARQEKYFFVILVVTKHILALVSLYYFNSFAGIPLTLALVLKCRPRLTVEQLKSRLREGWHECQLLFQIHHTCPFYLVF